MYFTVYTHPTQRNAEHILFPLQFQCKILRGPNTVWPPPNQIIGGAMAPLAPPIAPPMAAECICHEKY